MIIIIPPGGILGQMTIFRPAGKDLTIKDSPQRQRHRLDIVASFEAIFYSDR